MSISIKVKEDNEGQYLDLDDFSSFVDISQVEYYEFQINDGYLILKFYDKNRNLIEIKGN